MGSEWQRVADAMKGLSGGGGGNYYLSQPYRVSKRLARAVVTDTLAGHTLYADAYSMLGMRQHSTFERFAEAVLG